MTAKSSMAAASISKSLSQERVTDSDDGDKLSNSSEQAPTNRKKNQSSKSPNYATKTSRPAPTESVPNRLDDNTKDESESSSENSSSDESDSASQDSSSSSSKKRNVSSLGEAREQNAKRIRKNGPAVTMEPKVYKAPKDFGPLTVDASDYTSDALATFHDLRGKQIWHITVPDTVSLEQLRKLDISAAVRGEIVLKQGKFDYKMTTVSNDEQILLLPQGSNNEYEMCPTTIGRSFSIHQVDTVPSGKDAKDDDVKSSGAAQQFTAQAEEVRRGPRQQPQNLKMRYVPFGAAVQKGQLDSTAHQTRAAIAQESITQATPSTKSKKNKKSVQFPVDAMDVDDSLEVSRSSRKADRLSSSQETISSKSKDGRDESKKKKRSKTLAVSD